MKNTTACFTGHRPEKLPDGGADGSVLVSAVKSMLLSEINEAVCCGYNRFLTGMARGVDLWAGAMVADLIGDGVPVSLSAVFPYKGCENRYSEQDSVLSQKILSAADDVVYVSRGYYKGCMAERNRYLVEHSSRLIAVVTDYSSGTGQTIGFARKAGLELRIININELLPSDNGQLRMF